MEKCKDCKDVKKFESKFISGKAYTDTKISENIIFRTFKSSVNANLLKWHMDKEYRSIEIMNDTDWKFQFDNELPVKLSKGAKLGIPPDVYHRLIKGTTSLEIEITKMKPI